MLTIAKTGRQIEIHLSSFYHLVKSCLFFLFIMHFISSIANAQTISGNVTDPALQAGVQQALVEITERNNNTTDSVYTDVIGNWEYDLVLTGNKENNFIPNDFYVSQNYPNPFNPSTNINFQISTSSEVQIRIHNILGQLIDSRSEFLSAGSYSIPWRSKGSAGVYFYTIISGGKSLTKKMIQLDGGFYGGLGEITSGTNYSHSSLNKVNSIPLTIVISKFGYLSDTLSVDVDGGERFNTSLITFHSTCTLIDLHNDILELMIENPNYHLGDLHTYNHTDIPRLRKGGVDVQFFAVWVSPTNYSDNPYQHAVSMIDLFKAEAALNPDDLAQATNLNEAININDQGKIAGVLGVEGGHTIENSLEKLFALYDSGVRYLTITWNNSTDWAVSAQDPLSTTVGLSDFGREVIHKMDSLGMIIDVSHVGIKTIQDILDVTTNPIIASHSGARAVKEHYRNLYDSQIIDIANTGGVIGIVFYPPFLGSPSSSVNINTVIQHIDHIVNLVGIDFVAIGSDFDGIGTNTVNGLEDTSKFPALTLALLQHGYTEDDVRKILGGNFMRVFQTVCGN